MTERIRVVIVEDNWMVRDGLESLVAGSDQIEVVGTGSDGREAIELADTLEPDVMLMDIRMPHVDGLEATRRICREHPSVHVLILTSFVEQHLVQSALAAGAVGYLTKDVEASHLVQAVTTAATGIVQISPGVASHLRLLPGPQACDERERAAVAQLTPRERDVLRRLSTGATNREIGKELHLSAGTVKNLVSSILRQLELTDRTQAAVLAERHTIE